MNVPAFNLLSFSERMHERARLLDQTQCYIWSALKFTAGWSRRTLAILSITCIVYGWTVNWLIYACKRTERKKKSYFVRFVKKEVTSFGCLRETEGERASVLTFGLHHNYNDDRNTAVVGIVVINGVRVVVVAIAILYSSSSRCRFNFSNLCRSQRVCFICSVYVFFGSFWFKWLGHSTIQRVDRSIH